MPVNSISSFLKEHGIVFHIDKIDGHHVIFTDRGTPIFPISICSRTTEEASVSAKESQLVSDRICAKTGSYPLIITEECADDPDMMVKAIECLGWGRIVENNGQVCASPKRTIVHRRAHDAFVKCLLEFIKTVKVGLATDPETDLSHLVSVKAAKRVEEQVQHTINQGATLLCGGKAVRAGSDGRLFQTVYFLFAYCGDLDRCFYRACSYRAGAQAEKIRRDRSFY